MRTLSASRPRHEEEEESVFVSMTDMTVSFLFIVMILLAFFASQFRPDEQVPLVDYEHVVAERDTAVQDLSDTKSAFTELQARVAELEAELLRLKAQLTILRDKLVFAEETVVRLMDERDQLQTMLSQTQLERDTLRLTLAKAEAARDEARSSVEQQADRITALEAEIEALSEELARLRQPDPLEAYIAQVAAQREQVLKRLRDAILADFPELEGVISSESDVLRFQGEGLFASGADVILTDRIPIIQRIAERMDDLLPCYTLGQRAAFSEECNPAFAVIEAVQIEGHTDSDGEDAFNVALSARRGAATYGVMTAHMTQLDAHKNLNGQPVLSIAGYGEGRPVVANDTAERKSTNRRIDLRFIMVTPGKSDEISRIRTRLSEVDEP